ncbi:MAG: hypothetical protein ACETWB_09965 [Anaerolineae bacterium]
MTRVRCRQSVCIFWDNRICTADEIELDPEHGCLTFEELEDLIDDEDEWDDDDELDDEKWEDEDWDEFPYR